MGQAPDEIRREITITRERMTETLDAIREKADLIGRARASLHASADHATHVIRSVSERARNAF